MVEVRDEIWSLMAKYLLNEASPQECMVVELLLAENEALRNYFTRLNTFLLMDNKHNMGDPVRAFAKLDQRIKMHNPQKKRNE